MKILSGIGKAFKNKKVIISAVLIAALAAGGGIYFSKKGGKATAEVNTATAAKGDIRVVVSGSAALEAIESYEVKATVAGDVLSCSFSEGDKVEKDQVLYTIDTTDMQNTIDRAELSMEKSRDSYETTAKEVAKLTIKTPVRGVITNMYIKEGDNVSNGTKICDIVDNSTMTLTVPFNLSDADFIYNGQRAVVTLDNSFYETTGTVTRVSSGSVANENNVSTVYVDIEVSNPGGIKKGDTATAVIGDIACNSSGTFKPISERTITSEINGKVYKIYNDLGDNMYAGGVIALLSSDSLNDSLKSQRLNMKDAELSLKNTYDKLDNYTIKAPISGTVIYRNVKAGDTLDNTASAPTMCYIADLSTIVFSLSVDELDVSKIEVGQKVEIDADAVEGRMYDGFVKTVSINGTTVNGVTTYPVEIEVVDPEGLIPGMNVNADIIIEEKSDVLTVPVSAVFRGNMCYVKDDGSDGDKDDSKDKKTQKVEKNSDKKDEKNNEGRNSMIPDGFKPVKVTTGANDENYIEITGGLSEGDVVFVKSATGTTTNPFMQMQQGGMNRGQSGMPGSGQGGMQQGSQGGTNRSQGGMPGSSQGNTNRSQSGQGGMSGGMR